MSKTVKALPDLGTVGRNSLRRIERQTRPAGRIASIVEDLLAEYEEEDA